MQYGNLEMIYEEIEHLDLSKTILWVGCGVSINGPTGLPSGITLGNAYLEYAIGKENLINLNKKWNEGLEKYPCFSKKKTDLESDPKSSSNLFPMRLEFIIGEINYIDEEFENFTARNKVIEEKYKRAPLINGFSTFAEVEYNLNHKYISECMKKGAITVTANYDLCIEKAFESDYKIIEDKGLPTVVNDGQHYTYHFHGLADKESCKSLGATINTVKKMMPDPFRTYLIKLLRKGYNIIYLGYSGSDYFDITPFFEIDCKDENFPGTAIFVNHSADDSKTAAENPKAELLVSKFKKKYIISGKTGEFLSILSGQVFSAIESKQVVEWDEKFRDIIGKIEADKNRADVYHFINALRLCGQSGIHIKELYSDWSDWLKKIIDDFNSESGLLESLVKTPTDMTKTIFSNYLWETDELKDREIVYHKIRKRVRRHKYKRPTKYTFINYVSMQRMLSEARKLVLNEENRSYKKTESFIIQYMCGRFNFWIGIYNKYSLLRNIAKLKIKYYHKCFTYLSDLPYNQFLYISYYLTIWRKKRLAEAILQMDDYLKSYNHLQREYEIAYEIASLTQLEKISDNENSCLSHMKILA